MAEVQAIGIPPPIEKIPDEILEAIFTNANSWGRHTSMTRPSSATTGSTYCPPLGTLTMPLLLGSVNRHWRSVSLGLSSLWSFIAISSTRPLEQELWRAVIWLERSKRHPLTVFVDFEDTKRLEEDSGEPADLTPIYDLLLPHFDRWREVIIKVNAPSLLSAFKKFRDNQTQPLGRRLILSKKHVQARLWRYHLQKVMDKGRDTPPEEIERLDSALTTIVKSQSRITTEVLNYSGLDKVLCGILMRKPKTIPRNKELRIQSRALALLKVFGPLREKEFGAGTWNAQAFEIFIALHRKHVRVPNKAQFTKIFLA